MVRGGLGSLARPEPRRDDGGHGEPAEHDEPRHRREEVGGVLFSLDLAQGASGEDRAAIPRDRHRRDADASPRLPRDRVRGVLAGGVEDTQRRDRVAAVELPIRGEDLSGGVDQTPSPYTTRRACLRSSRSIGCSAGRRRTRAGWSVGTTGAQGSTGPPKTRGQSRSMLTMPRCGAHPRRRVGGVSGRGRAPSWRPRTPAR